MDKEERTLFKGKPILWLFVGLLCLVSVIEVFSATSRMTFGGDQNYLMPVLKHVVHLVLGFVVLFLVHRIPYRFFKAIPYILLPVTAAALVCLMVKSAVTGVTDRWIQLPGFSIQPSELAKMGVIVAVAALLAKLDEEDELSQVRIFWRILLLSGSFILMIMPENLSTAVLLAIVVFLMMIVGGIRPRYLLYLTGTCVALGGAMLAVMLYVSPQKIEKSPLPSRFLTWQARVLDFVDGSDKNLTPQDYVRTIARDKPQETHANIAIASSHILGRGPGNSVERDFVQEASCDFIYAIIIEELGLLGALVVLFIYLWILLKSGGVAARCGSRKFPRYLAMGIAFLITLQAFVNMSVAVGLIPVTGQPLPLISTGGTSILITFFYFGMLISISWSGEEEHEETVETAEEN
ncbi:MAG: FtsW/RodA/SpoVE family cell cycle protein [Bacteroidaceae bacterium]|nr:FtsW/RodA/SpoVE family cell cycle protein [Bacteroidaceae bacterium]